MDLWLSRRARTFNALAPSTPLISSFKEVSIKVLKFFRNENPTIICRNFPTFPFKFSHSIGNRETATISAETSPKRNLKVKCIFPIAKAFLRTKCNVLLRKQVGKTKFVDNKYINQIIVQLK